MTKTEKAGHEAGTIGQHVSAQIDLWIAESLTTEEYYRQLWRWLDHAGTPAYQSVLQPHFHRIADRLWHERQKLTAADDEPEEAAVAAAAGPESGPEIGPHADPVEIAAVRNRAVARVYAEARYAELCGQSVGSVRSQARKDVIRGGALLVLCYGLDDGLTFGNCRDIDDVERAFSVVDKAATRIEEQIGSGELLRID